jgi:hypothetical protein
VDKRALRRPKIDPPVGLQPLQGFAYRLPTYAQILSKFVLDQMLAALQRALHDQVHDRVVDGLPQGSGALHSA